MDFKIFSVVSMSYPCEFPIHKPTEEVAYLCNRVRLMSCQPRNTQSILDLYHEIIEFIHSGYFRKSSPEIKHLLESVGTALASSGSCEKSNSNHVLSTNLVRFMLEQIGIITGTSINTPLSDHEFTNTERLPTHSLVPYPAIFRFGTYAHVKPVDDLQSFMSAMEARHPCIVRGGCGFWQSCIIWSELGFWRTFRGQLVPVELGTYLSDDFEQKLVDLADYMEYIFNEESFREDKLYLAQYDLFTRQPDLEDHVLPLPDFAQLMSSSLSRSMFIGPKGTVSPLHTDPHDNLLCQIVGTKQVILFPPSESDNLYVKDQKAASKTTQIPHDPTLLDDSIIDEQFPKLRETSGVHATLSPGDCLYIPDQWFHFVKSHSPAISLAHFVS